MHPQLFVQAHGLQRACINPRVRHIHHATHTTDHANACDHAATGHALGQVFLVQAQTGQGGQLEKRRAGVEQQRQAFTRQQLLAFVKARFGRRRLLHRALFKGTHLRQQFEHALAVGLKAVAVNRECGVELGHGVCVVKAPAYAGAARLSCADWLSRKRHLGNKKAGW